VKVYRLRREDLDYGPMAGAWTMPGNGHAWGLPEPREEGLNMKRGVHVCGTATPELLLKRWFKNSHKALNTEGFRVFVLEVPDEEVQVGKLQVIFNPEKATVLEVLPVHKAKEKLCQPSQ
jgi:hypothetical protein